MPNYRNNGGGGGGGRRGGGGGGGGGGGRGNYHQPRTTRVDVTLQRESQYVSPMLKIFSNKKLNPFPFFFI